jgi:hypothetical protein
VHSKKKLTVPAANGVEGPLPCAEQKMHGKEATFVVRRTKNARQRSYLCRAPALETHGKGTIPAGGNSAFVVRLHLDARQTFSKKIKKPKPLPRRLECLLTNHCIYR